MSKRVAQLCTIMSPATRRTPSDAGPEIASGPGPQDAAVPGDVDAAKDEEINEAWRLSIEEAERKEGELVVAGILRSKIDAPPVSNEEAVIFRSTGTSSDIIQTVLDALELAKVRGFVSRRRAAS